MTEPSPPRRRIVVIGFAALVVIATVIGLVVALSSDSPKDNVAASNTLDVGAVAPDFSLPGVNGGTVSLADYRGKLVILTFGASYCHPCRQEFPLLAKAAKAHPAVKVVGVDPEDLPGDMQRMMRSTGATWPTGDDARGLIAARYGVTTLPVTFFVDTSGTIVARGFGLTSQDRVDEPLNTLLHAA